MKLRLKELREDLLETNTKISTEELLEIETR